MRRAFRDGAASQSAINTLQRAVAVGAVLGSMALVVVDAGMVTVALPSIGESLGVTPAVSLRVVVAYQTALLIALLPTAALAERVGYRRVFSVGLLWFVACAFLGAFAPSLGWLIAIRFVQGLGGAAIMALGIAILRQALPASSVGAAIGWNAITVAVGSAAGPMIGAFVISHSEWRWIFLTHLPLGLLALVATRALPAIPGAKLALDLPGMALSAGGFASLILGADALAHRPDLASLLFAAGACSFWLLIRRGMTRSPVFPIDLLRIRPFRLSVMASVCCFIGQSTGMLALPFYLQQTLHQAPIVTGYYLALWPSSVAGAAVVSSHLCSSIPSHKLGLAGGSILALGLAGLAGLPTDASPLWVVVLTIFCGAGFGLFQVPNNKALFLAAPVARAAAAGGMQGTARLSGQTIGAVFMTLLFVWFPISHAPRWGLVIGAAFALGAGLILMLSNPSANS